MPPDMHTSRLVILYSFYNHKYINNQENHCIFTIRLVFHFCKQYQIGVFSFYRMEQERREKKRKEGLNEQDDESDEEEDNKIEIPNQKDMKSEKRDVKPEYKKRKPKS